LAAPVCVVALALGWLGSDDRIAWLPAWDVVGLNARSTAGAALVAQSAIACPSAVAFDGHVERSAYLSHPVVAESSEALNEHCDGHALDGVEVNRGSAGDWIVVGL